MRRWSSLTASSLPLAEAAAPLTERSAMTEFERGVRASLEAMAKLHDHGGTAHSFNIAAQAAIRSLLPSVAPPGDREAVAWLYERKTARGEWTPEVSLEKPRWYPEARSVEPLFKRGDTTPAQPAEERAVLDAMWSCVEKATLPDSGYCCQDHLFSMLSRMRSFEEDGKFNRWLGYIQGVLVATNNGTVEQFKDMNRSPAALDRARAGSEEQNDGRFPDLTSKEAQRAIRDGFRRHADALVRDRSEEKS